MTSSTHHAVKAAITALQQGKIILLTDPMDRENEGDFVFPAETITPEVMRFMIHYGTGIVCVTLPESHLKKLSLSLMVPEGQNTTRYNTPFTLPVDAKEGVTTGVSAADRAKTVLTLMSPTATTQDLVRPGHVYPLQARAGGVLERNGHTEGALDIVKLAGFQAGAVLCEAIHPDGTMVKGKDLITLAKTHDLAILSVDDLIAYRLATENLIADTAEAHLPTAEYGNWKISIIREKYSDAEHTILFKTSPNNTIPSLVRVHSCCQTGDLFGSLRCDCQQQLHYAMRKMSEEGGALIYLNQEGRGIGLFNKIKAYALQEQGMDTVEANLALGFSADSRGYHIVPSILRQLGMVDHVRLLTNNPQKIAELKRYGMAHVEREIMPNFENMHNQHYLATKKNRLNHDIN